MLNPSLITVNRTKVAVPHANYTVSIFNRTSKTFEPVNCSVLCDYDLKTGKEDNCWMHVNMSVSGHSLAFVMISRNDMANSIAKRFDHNSTANTKIEDPY